MEYHVNLEHYGNLVYHVTLGYNFEDWAKELGVPRELGVLCELGALRVLGVLRSWSASRTRSTCDFSGYVYLEHFVTLEFVLT